MKSGNAQPKKIMSSRPPVRSASSAINDLERVESITEVPARVAAVILDKKLGQEPPAAIAAAPKANPGKEVMPWDLIEDKGNVSFNFKLPSKLAAKLKFLGGTTYGQNMTTLVIAAVEWKVAQMLAERDLD